MRSVEDRETYVLFIYGPSVSPSRREQSITKPNKPILVGREYCVNWLPSCGWASRLCARPQGDTQVPPYQAFDLIDVGVDLRVHPGQRLPMQTADAHPHPTLLLTWRSSVERLRPNFPSLTTHVMWSCHEHK
jgi:hypothetical protein